MNYYWKLFIKSYILRLLINLIFVVLMHKLMLASVQASTHIDISLFEINNMNTKTFGLAEYIFNETAVIVTILGLILVALIEIYADLHVFIIITNENYFKFRLRLAIYNAANLAICCIISLYFLVLAGAIMQFTSHRIDPSISFIWLYPFYGIIIILYLCEIYNFLTHNSTQ